MVALKQEYLREVYLREYEREVCGELWLMGYRVKPLMHLGDECQVQGDMEEKKGVEVVVQISSDPKQFSIYRELQVGFLIKWPNP